MIQVPTPSGIYGYIDKVTVWFETPLPRKALRFLKAQCGQGGLHVLTEPAWFNRDLQQRIQLNQPNTEALTYLGERDQWINYVEIALDWVFDDEQQKDRAYDLISRHHVQRWHGKQEVRFKNGTRYSAQRRAHNTLAIYADKPCRITGEVDCVHLDWRVKGKKSVERMGIGTCQELINFKHRKFWEKKLILADIDRKKLGRIYNNRVNKSARRGPWIEKCRGGFLYDLDQAAGNVLINRYQTIQQTLDGVDDAAKCLEKIKVDHLLPRQGEENRGKGLHGNGLQIDRVVCGHIS